MPERRAVQPNAILASFSLALVTGLLLSLATMSAVSTRQADGTLRPNADRIELAVFTGAITIQSSAGAEVGTVLADAQGKLKLAHQGRTDASGLFSANLSPGAFWPSPAVIHPTDLLSVTIGSSSTSLAVPALVAAVDMLRGQIVGETVPNDLVEIAVFDPRGQALAATQLRTSRRGEFRLSVAPALVTAFRQGAWGTATIRRNTVSNSAAAALRRPGRGLFLDGPRFAPFPSEGTASWSILTRFEALTARIMMCSTVIDGAAARGVGLNAELIGDGGRLSRGDRGESPAGDDAYRITLADEEGAHRLRTSDALAITPTLGSSIGGVVPRFKVSVNRLTQQLVGSALPETSVRLSVVPDAAEADVGAVQGLSVTTDAVGRFEVPWTRPEALSARAWVTAELDAFPFTFVARGRVNRLEAPLFGTRLVGSAAPGSPVYATVIRADGRRLAMATLADDEGRFRLDIAASPPTDEVAVLRPGDALLVGFDDAPIEQIVLPAADAYPDLGGNAVAGHAPPGSLVELELTDRAGPPRMTVADEAGRFRFELGSDAPLTVRSSGWVRVNLNGSQHTVVAGWSVPGATLVVGSDLVRGRGSPGEVARLAVSRCGREGGTGSAISQVRPTEGHGEAVGWQVALHDEEGLPRQVALGDTLMIELGQRTLELGVPNVTLAGNTELDFVTGLGPPGLGMEVAIGRGAQSEHWDLTVAQDGRYELPLGDRWDLAAGDLVTASVTLAPGFVVAVPDQVARLDIQPELGRVQGYTSVGALVTGELRRSNGEILASGKARANGYGGFDLALRDAFGAPAGLAEGQRIDVLVGNSVTQAAVPLATLEVDSQAGAVIGRAAPGSRVAVSIAPPGCAAGSALLAATTADPIDGGFRVIVPPARLMAGAEVVAEQHSPAGDGFTVRRRVPQVSVQVHGDLVLGRVAAGSRLQVDVKRATGPKASVAWTAGDDGAFELHLAGLGAPGLRPGDTLALRWTDGQGAEAPKSGRIDLDLPNLTSAIDAETRLVTGLAPPGSTLLLSPSAPGLRQDGSTIAAQVDAGGRYTATFPTTRPDRLIAAGSSVEVGLASAGGHRVFARAVTPFLELVIGEAGLAGRAMPMTSNILEHWRGGRQMGSATAASDTYGQFESPLAPDGPTGAEMVRTGDEVRLIEPSGRETRLTVPDLTVQVNRSAKQIGGVAPPGAALDLLVYARGRDAVGFAVPADGRGSWTVGDSLLRTRGLAIDQIASAELRLFIGSGHLVVARTPPAAGIPTAPKPSPTPPSSTATPTSATPDPPTPTATPASETSTPPAARAYLPWLVVRIHRTGRVGDP